MTTKRYLSGFILKKYSHNFLLTETNFPIWTIKCMSVSFINITRNAKLFSSSVKNVVKIRQKIPKFTRESKSRWKTKDDEKTNKFKNLALKTNCPFSRNWLAKCWSRWNLSTAVQVVVTCSTHCRWYHAFIQLLCRERCWWFYFLFTFPFQQFNKLN